MKIHSNLLFIKLLILIILNAYLNISAQAQKPELVLQTGHSFQVVNVIFSPSGKLLASSSEDNTIKIWDVASGKELRTLIGHSNSVVTLSFSPNEKLLVSGDCPFNGGYSSGKLWDIESGKELLSLDFNFCNSSVDFSSDGMKFVTGGWANKIEMWEVKSGKKIIEFNDSKDVSKVKFSPDNKILASGNNDGTITIWDVSKGEVLRTLSIPAEHAAISSLSFSPDGNRLVSGGYLIKLWDVKTGKKFTPIFCRILCKANARFHQMEKICLKLIEEDRS